ncbi:hypothetical protein FOL47_008792 [Perkinsus chesapeaki]|uniref:RRM domain-containing protein n=1 Tax=Perkinsus chesapeaki TaxID=330153 RepID=A0A7J6MT28_PERCH|nr:hypothetical protein FOL47_008792 [Perkinsus chesapeaki]
MSTDQRYKNVSENTVYVEGLPFSWTEEDIYNHFKECGQILSVRAPKWEDSGRLRGYAHVTLADENAFGEALKLDGSKAWAGGSGRQRWLKVTEAKAGGQDSGASSWSPKQVDDKAKILFVKNLPYDISEVEISKLFAKMGGIDNIRVVTAGPDRRNKGFCYVTFESTGVVRRICARKEPWKLKGRTLQLDADDGTGLKAGFHYRAEAYETGHGRKVKRQYTNGEEAKTAAEEAPRKKGKTGKAVILVGGGDYACSTGMAPLNGTEDSLSSSPTPSSESSSSEASCCPSPSPSESTASICSNTGFLDYLWRGEYNTIATSSMSTYGENTRGSMLKLFNVLKADYGLDNTSVFLDIGSGRGIPSLLAALIVPGIKASLGVEFDKNVYFLSLLHHFETLQEVHGLGSGTNGRSTGNESTPPTQSEMTTSLTLNTQPLNIHFKLMNAAHLTQFEPVTHIYTFDLAMPPDYIAHFVKLFNQSTTCRVYVSYRSDLVSSFGMKATLCEKILMTMTTSSEDHTAYVYVRGTKGHAEDAYMTRAETVQSLCATLRARLRDPRSDDLETTCMHLVQMATRPLDQQVAELQAGAGQVLRIDIIHGHMPDYGFGIFCEVGSGPNQLWALIDTGSSDFFLVWKEWYESKVGVGSCANLAAGCYTCPSHCVPGEKFHVTFGDGLEVDIFGYLDTVRIGSTEVPDVLFGLICNQDPSPTEEKPISSLGLSPFVEEECFNSLLEQLVDAKRIESLTFAIYLQLADNPKGELLLGGGDPTIYKHPLQYVELDSRDEYMITLNSLQVGDGYLTIGINQQIILDTGSNRLHVPQLYFHDLSSKIMNDASKSSRTEIPFTWNEGVKVWSFPCAYGSYLPSLRLGLGHTGDAVLILTHANYVRAIDDDCFLILQRTAETEWLLPGDGFIGKYFEFQPERSRVGFADLATGST